MRLRGENLDVVWAVHRLQHEAVEQLVVGLHPVGRDRDLARPLVDLLGELGGDGLEAHDHLGAGTALVEDSRQGLVFDDGRELRFLVIRKVAGGLVELELADVRREDLRVALLAQFLADEVLQFLADDGAVRRPEDEALADVIVDDEELQVATELAVVAGLGLLDALEVLREFFPGREGGAVDALELLVVLVAAVVGAGDREQLEGLQLARVAHVGARAEVDELAILVKRNFFALGNTARRPSSCIAPGPIFFK